MFFVRILPCQRLSARGRGGRPQGQGRMTDNNITFERSQRMKVKELMSTPIEMILSDENLMEAAETMRSMEIGGFPVSESDELVGFITDRDIVVRGIAQGKDPTTTFVGEIMTTDVYHCFEDDDVKEAAKEMEERSIRRLVVFNTEYEPTGIISLADFALKSHDEHLTCELLECVSEP